MSISPRSLSVWTHPHYPRGPMPNHHSSWGWSCRASAHPVDPHMLSESLHPRSYGFGVSLCIPQKMAMTHRDHVLDALCLVGIAQRDQPLLEPPPSCVGCALCPFSERLLKVSLNWTVCWPMPHCQSRPVRWIRCPRVHTTCGCDHHPQGRDAEHCP